MISTSLRRLFAGLTVISCLIAFLLVVEVGCAAPPTVEQQALALSQLRLLVAENDNNPASDRLIAFEKQNSNTKAAALARFLRGYQAYQANNFAVAIDALSGREIQTETSVGDYALYFWGISLQQLNKQADAYRIFDRLVKEQPTSRFAREAKLRGGEALLASGDPQLAIRYVAELAAAGDGAALYLTGRGQEARGEKQNAIATYRKAYFLAPTVKESDASGERLQALGVDLNSPYEDALSRAELLYKGGQFGSAANTYNGLFAAYPDRVANASDAAKKDELALHYGASLYSSASYQPAVTQLLAVSNRDADIHAQALYFLEESYLRLRLSGQAITAANQLVSQHPRSLLAGAGLYHLGLFFEKNGDQSSASEYYSRLVKEYPHADGAVNGSFFVAWRSHQAHNYKMAANQLMQHLADYPESDNRAKSAFWGAFDEERAGNFETALTLYQGILGRYEYSYYGYVAKKHIGDLEAAHRGLKPLSPAADSTLARALENLKLSPAPTETVIDSVGPNLTKASQLRDIGAFDLALDELEALRLTAPTSLKVNLAIAQVFAAQTDPVRAITALKRAYPDYPYYRQDEVPQDVWDIFFPLREWQTIKAEAAKYNLDPYLVAGFIRQESIFNPRATSRANARGMMQLLYSTARPIAKQTGLPPIGAADLYNPTINIKLGVAYLSELFQQFGRIEYIAAAYNAGPGRVVRWKRELPGTSMEEWVESIPLSETRSYVQGILRNAANYRRLYGETKTAANGADVAQAASLRASR